MMQQIKRLAMSLNKSAVNKNVFADVVDSYNDKTVTYFKEHSE